MPGDNVKVATGRNCARMDVPAARVKKIRHKDGSDGITHDATRRRSLRTASQQNIEPACYEMRFAHFRQRFGSLRDAPDFLQK